MASEIDNLIRELRRHEGVEVEHAQSGHRKIRLHGRTVATVSLSPSDHRALRNICRELSKHGIVVSFHKRRPPKKKKVAM